MGADALDVPNEASRAVEAALAKPALGIGRIETHDLEQERAVFIVVGVGRDNGSAAAVRLRRRRIGHEAHRVSLGPRGDERLALELLLGLALLVGDEVEQAAATLLAVVVPLLPRTAEGAGAVGVGAVPPQLFVAAPVRLAP
jgi:hypothetical protein